CSQSPIVLVCCVGCEPSAPSSLAFFTPISTSSLFSLSLHDALPIYVHFRVRPHSHRGDGRGTPHTLRPPRGPRVRGPRVCGVPQDRKSTRLNSCHVAISYAVFCLKKK